MSLVEGRRRRRLPSDTGHRRHRAAPVPVPVVVQPAEAVEAVAAQALLLLLLLLLLLNLLLLLAVAVAAEAVEALVRLLQAACLPSPNRRQHTFSRACHAAQNPRSICRMSGRDGLARVQARRRWRCSWRPP